MTDVEHDVTPGDEAEGGGEPVLVSVETPRPGTRDPHRSRVRALKVLFQADLRGQDPSAAVAGIAIDPAAVALLDDLDLDGVEAGAGGDGLDDYARTLIDGVAVRRHALDRIISRFSHRWEVNRMPVVDRNILRLGTFELLFEDVSPAVVIDEALELAKQHSTDASHRFVNGILEAVRREAPDLRAELDRPPADDEPPAEPDEALSEDTLPDDAMSEEALPGDAVSEEEPPADAASEDALPHTTVPVEDEDARVDHAASEVDEDPDDTQDDADQDVAPLEPAAGPEDPGPPVDAPRDDRDAV